MAGAPVDDIDLALSAIGLGAVAIVPLTGGSSLLLKTGASMAKTAYRIGVLSAPVLAAARRAAGTGVDWRRVAEARPATFSDDMARAIDPEALAPAVAYLGAVGEIKAATNVVDTLRLVRGIDDLNDARRMSLAARSLGPRTTRAMELVGKTRLFRAAARWADEVYAMLASAVFFVSALVGLILGVGKAAAIRRLRRTARQETPRAG